MHFSGDWLSDRIDQYRIDGLTMLGVGLVAILVLLPQISKPFWGEGDWNNALWSVAARNNLELGVACTKLLQITSYAPAVDCQHLSDYSNYPPLITWWLTLFYASFGLSEAGGRLSMALISSISVMGVFGLGRLLYGRWVGIWSAAIWMVTPMHLYWGKQIFHDVWVLSTILWGTILWVAWTRQRGRGWMWWYLVVVTLSGLAGWQGYLYFPLLVGLWRMGTRQALTGLQWVVPATTRAALTVTILLAIFGLHQLHIYGVTGQWRLGEMLSQLVVRTNLTHVVPVSEEFAAAAITFTPGAFLVKQGGRLIEWYTLPVLALAVGAVSWIGYQQSKRNMVASPPASLYKWIWSLNKLGSSHLVLLGLGGYALLTFVVFSEMVFVHNFLVIYWLPFISLAAGWSLYEISKRYDRVIQISLGILVLGVILWVGNPRVQSAYASHQHQAFYGLVTLIRQKGLEKRYLVASGNYALSFPIVYHYAYGVATVTGKVFSLEEFQAHRPDFEASADYLVFTQDDLLTKGFMDYLSETYPGELVDVTLKPHSEEKVQFLVFSLVTPPSE